MHHWSIFDSTTSVTFPWVPREDILFEQVPDADASFDMGGIGFYYIELDYEGTKSENSTVANAFLQYLIEVVETRSKEHD